jgi:hypothetical protein
MVPTSGELAAYVEKHSEVRFAVVLAVPSADLVSSLEWSPRMQFLPRGMQDLQLRLPVSVNSRHNRAGAIEVIRTEFCGFGAPSWNNPQKPLRQQTEGGSERKMSLRPTAPASALPLPPPYRRLPVAAEGSMRSPIQSIRSNPRSA